MTIFDSKITQAEQLGLFFTKIKNRQFEDGAKVYILAKVLKKCNARLLEKLKKCQFFGPKITHAKKMNLKKSKTVILKKEQMYMFW